MRSGHKVRRINAVLQHPTEPWMLANLDREVMGAPDVQILECKTAGFQGSFRWRDGVPDEIKLQVMHQLAVTGKQAADVAVLICGQDLQIHRINRDESMIARLMELERQFWHYVETDTPPPADGSDSADVALRALYPQDHGQTLDLSQDLEMSATFSDLLAVRQELTKFNLLESQLKQRIQQRMGDATKVVFETGDVTWKRSKDGSGLNVEKLLKDHPEFQTSYSMVKPGSRRFLVNT
jgi:predicted phage-related endonuclease